MTEPIDLSVVIPVYNEEQSVGLVHSELTAALEPFGASYELIFVDDGSTDSTLDELLSICRQDPRATVIRFRRNYGQSAAIQAGFDHATGGVLVTLDGDLQNDPADIPALLAAISEGYDVVCGWRRRRRDRFLSRRLPSLTANWLIARITGIRIHDNGCTMRAYRREFAKKVRLYSEMHRFLAPLLSLSGCRYKEVTVNHRPRRFGRSKYGLARIWSVALDLLVIKMLIRFTVHPAAWFAVLCAPFALASVLAGGVSVFLYAAANDSGDFPIIMPSITLLCVFLWLHLLLSGICAELVVRAGDYRESDPIVATVIAGDAEDER